MKNTILMMTAALALVACAPGAPASDADSRDTPEDEFYRIEPPDIPLVRVLVDPESFVGKQVVVTGVYAPHKGYGYPSGLYLDDGSRRARVSANRLILPHEESLPASFVKYISEAEGKYVTVVGTVRKVRTAKPFPYALDDVVAVVFNPFKEEAPAEK